MRSPEQQRARDAVVRAVRNGQLAPITTRACAECCVPARHYHHHLGYAAEHWLNVRPLCSRCHKRAHIRAAFPRNTERRTKEVAVLVSALVAVQHANGWTDAEMAQRLQVARSMWGHIQTGEKQPGLRFLRGVAAGWPDLEQAAWACLVSVPSQARSRARTPRQEA